MLIFNPEKRDLDSERHWIEYQPGVRFQISAWNSIECITAMGEQPELLDPNSDDFTRVQRFDAMCKVVAQTILHDWEGVYISETEEFPYSRENAEVFLKNSPLILTFIRGEAQALADAQEEDIEKTSKKLLA